MTIENMPRCEMLELVVGGARLTLTFTRPNQRNAINSQMGYEISAVGGFAFGGGMGYACPTGITIVARGVRIAVPETTLGVAPAQIAPAVVAWIGLTRARQLALTAEYFGGEQAYEYGIAQYLCEDDALDATVDDVVARTLRCGPQANAATKDIMRRVGRLGDEELVAYAPGRFAELNRGAEAREGQAAFAEKRRPAWQVNKGASE